MNLQDTIKKAVAGLELETEPTAKERYADGLNRLDGLINIMSGIGTSHDRSTYSAYQLGTGSLSSELVEELFRNNDLARRMIVLRSSEATRQGFAVKCDDSDAVMAEVERLNLLSHVRQAMIWARAYGGSILVVGARDGAEPGEPVNVASLDAVDWLHVVPRSNVRKGPKVFDLTNPLFGRVEWYDVQLELKFERVHASRVIEFTGPLTPANVKAQNGGWDDSILQVAYSALRDFDTGFAAVPTMLSEANQSVMSIDGLIDMLTEQDLSKVKARLDLINLTRGVARMLFLDAGSEKYETHELSFNGVAMVLDRIMMRLSAAVEIPVTILMGRSPAGENATGDSDFRWFYDTIRTEQGEYLKPRLNELLRFLFLAKTGPTKGKIPEAWSVEFNSLWQETNRERADRELVEAQRDCLYIDRSVITPEQTALGRFNDATMISVDREAIEAQQNEQVKAQVEGLQVTPTDTANTATVDEIRAAGKLGPWHNPIEGRMPYPEFKALMQARIAAIIAKSTPQDPITGG